MTINLTYKGEPGDFVDGDAMPSEATGWVVSTARDQEGDRESLTLLGEQSFEPGATLPNTFADSDTAHRHRRQGPQCP